MTMDKVDNILLPFFDLNALPKEEEEEQVIKDVGLDRQKDIQDLISEIEKDIELDQVLEKEEDEDDDDEDEEEVYKDLEWHPRVASWYQADTGEINHGIDVLDVVLSTVHKRYEFDRCPICVKPWTLDKIHQMSCLPCGHMFGMSCLKKWMKAADKVEFRVGSEIATPTCQCPLCFQDFSLESVRLLYVTRLCIPSAADRKASIKRFSFSKIGFTSFKKVEQQLRTNAIKHRSDVLKQRAYVLGRQNDAMKWRTELLSRMADAEKRADILERQNDAMKRQLLNRMTDEEEWAEASEQQADAEKRAEVLRRKVGALAQLADEYLLKADAFRQQAKALRRQAKSLRQLVDSYLASRKFYIQSYKEFLGLHDNKITQ